MSGNYLSELPAQSSLVILNYSPLQAAQHLTRTSSYQGKPPTVSLGIFQRTTMVEDR